MNYSPNISKKPFLSLRTTKLGTAGEKFIERHLRAKGLKVYKPGRGKHPIDFAAIDTGNRVWLVDVKTYPRRWAYADTGVDTKDWKVYCRLADQNGNRVLLYFVDLKEQSVYRYRITPELRAKAYDHNGKTYFPLADREMIIEQISEDSLQALRQAAIK